MTDRDDFADLVGK